MRAVGSVVIVVIGVWLGSVLGGCLRSMPPCECPAAREIDPAMLTITKASRPELVGGNVEVSRDKVVVRYGDEFVVFARKPGE